MSPQSIVDLQRKMGENCEEKLVHWKTEIEKVEGAALLLKEVETKQVGNSLAAPRFPLSAIRHKQSTRTRSRIPPATQATFASSN